MSLQTWEDTEDRQDDFLRALADERELCPPCLGGNVVIVASATMPPESTTCKPK